jgi:pimeloyl-ACP methyl ester carboxylesterase
MSFVLVHGMWHSGESWYKVESILTAQGADVFAPTLTAPTEQERSSGKVVGLTTHIHDIVKVLEDNDLTDAILVGHSYGGLVISGVADSVPQRIQALVFLDAFIPEDGQSLFDLIDAEAVTWWRENLVDAAGRSRVEGATDVWLLPSRDSEDFGVEDPTDVAWLAEHMPMMPVFTFEEPLRLRNPVAKALTRYFIRCRAGTYFAPQEEKARALGWEIFQIDTGHDAMMTEPVALAAILTDIAARRAQPRA